MPTTGMAAGGAIITTNIIGTATGIAIMGMATGTAIITTGTGITTGIAPVPITGRRITTRRMDITRILRRVCTFTSGSSRTEER
jgi:hypothetical protein